MIVNARVADSTGSPLRKVNVRIVADRIAEVGQFESKQGERVIDELRVAGRLNSPERLGKKLRRCVAAASANRQPLPGCPEPTASLH